MRIRSIKPEFWRSEDITALPWHERLLFIGLWSYVDDNGVGLDNLPAVAADLFAGDLAVDAGETFARVSRGLQRLAERKLITRFEVAGKAYLHIRSWDEHQRIDHPNKPRYPLPTCDDASLSRESREILAPGAVEQGIKDSPASDDAGSSSSTSKKPRNNYPDPEFLEFWATYPCRLDKADAFKAWKTARKAADPAEIVAGAARYASDPNRDAEYTKYPATWLRAAAWDNGPLPAKTNGSRRLEPAQPGFWGGASA